MQFIDSECRGQHADRPPWFLKVSHVVFISKHLTEPETPAKGWCGQFSKHNQNINFKIENL